MNRLTRLSAIVIALLAAALIPLLASTPVRADGIIIIDPPIPVPPPDWSQWLTIRYHHVTVTIEDQVAITEVDQLFRNDTAVAVEGTYVFPLPAGAIVEDFKMWVDGQPQESKILPAEEARIIYEDYVRRNQDPALLEYVGRDAVQARIFPIPPHTERRIQLRYVQVLPTEERLMHYRYPLDTERFSAKPLEQVSISVTIASPSELGAIYSPTHQDKIMVTRETNRRASVSYEASDLLPMDDFELYIGLREEPVEASVLSFKPLDEDGFFLLLLAPSITDPETGPMSRDLIFVLDTSGSMDGEKLAQAKTGLAYILDHLNTLDRFNVIAFSTAVRSYTRDLVSAEEVEDAIAWVEKLEAVGGTNIHMALSEALSQADPDRHTTIVFLTDGLPTEGIVEDSAILRALEQEAPRGVRIFPLGVGYDVNVLLLDEIASAHRGRSTYIEPDERIDEKVSAFFARMQSPLLVDIDLEFGEAPPIYDVYPSPLPDLYAGTQLIVVGRYPEGGNRQLQVTGRVNERQISYDYEVSLSNHDGTAFIPRLWAAKKIGHLLTRIRLDGENAEWVDAVVKLSLRYGIITSYTSFLIEEPQESLTEEARARAGAQMMDELAEAPTAVSGQGAVEDAKLREGLLGAEAPIDPGAYAPVNPEEESGGASLTAIRHVADKTFICTADRCVDTAYVPDQMPLQEIAFGSRAYETLLEAGSEWGAYFAVGPGAIVVGPEGQAYHLVFESHEESQLAPSTTTPTATAGPAQDPETATPVPTAAPIGEPEDETQNSPQQTGLCSASLLLLVPVVGIALKKRVARS
ncbi:MAG: VIT domain-containing protein [Anaerolineae bacterium]